MARNNDSNISKDRKYRESDTRATALAESTNNWDTTKERAKQQTEYWRQYEQVATEQIKKEVVSLNTFLLDKGDKLCQLDRQFVKAKLTLIQAKLEASSVAESQLIQLTNRAPTS